ncbi:MAG: sodium-dependent transporter [Candidatus Hydrothermota bacterium]|nr:MAG: sodium-dependent transporter [Candidatus Hydrothermae bacterium]
MAQHTLWESRRAFVLASIGSAIGLGNVWRFPYICYKFGGGAFLFAYVIALVLIGIPLLALEFTIGYKLKGSAPYSFGKLRYNLVGYEENEERMRRKGKFEWIGWFALLVSFGIVTYYAVIMGWATNYLVYSFKLSWGSDPRSFFYQHVLGLTDGIFHFGKIQWPIVAGLAVSWIWIVLSIWKGAKTVGKVVYVTVVLPWFLLLIFVIRGLTLPGAMEGVKYYLTPRFEFLLNPALWHAAISQVFFSLSVGFGIMIAYASFLPPGSDVLNNAFLVAFSDAATAYVSGFAVFSALGYYARMLGTTVDKVMKSGPELAFVTYPTIINHLPLAPLFGILFFLMLLTLAVDSAFSMVEGGAAALIDKFHFPRKKANIGIAVVAFVIGILYTTGAGLYWLDLVDHFMNNFGLFVVALLESLVIAYVYGAENLRKYANSVSELKVGRWWSFSITVLVPAASFVLLIYSFRQVLLKPYGGYPRIAEILGGWLLVIGFLVIAILLSRRKSKEA